VNSAILYLAHRHVKLSRVYMSVFSESRTVEEIIELRTSFGATGTLCQTKLSCSFVTPVVKFSEENVNFRVEMEVQRFV